MFATVRRWWPLPVAVVAGLGAEAIFKASYGQLGEHAAGHLKSASVLFSGLGLVAIAFWAASRARRQLDAWLSAAAWLVGLVVVMIGNLQVVHAVGDRDWTEEEAATLGAQLPGFEAGHQVASVGAYIGVGAAVLLAIVLLARGHVSRRVGLGAIALSLVFPPWIIPGAGMNVLGVAPCVARRRREVDTTTAPGAVTPQPSYP